MRNQCVKNPMARHGVWRPRLESAARASEPKRDRPLDNGTVMGRPCSICKHPEAAHIAQALAEDASVRKLAARFGLTKSAINRHLNKCLTPRRPERYPRIRQTDEGRENRRTRSCTKCAP